MVSIKGMIIRCSSVIPELKEAVFRCLVCGFYSEPVMVDRGTVLINILIHAILTRDLISMNSQILFIN
jgi:DNA replicative helicase MCM subunit Mcm2 (Cdc46/Mcm family)